ncbi:MAG: PAS domain-containing protein [Dehalococcoidia bacterium]|nr:PAS domain-containing protein [Dehalococcoidia bacterium]
MTVKETSNLLIQERIKELRDNTDFVSTLLESLVGYAIIAADFDGNIIAYNQGAHQIYGYAPEKIIGKQGIEIFFPGEFIKAGKLQQIIDELIEKGRFSCEGEKVKKSGEVFPAQILFTLTRDKGGKTVGFIEIVEDLTERKKVEEANLRIQHLERELESLARLSPPQRTTATAQALGLQVLEQSSPDSFDHLVGRYGDLMELALEQRAFKVRHDISGDLQDMAEELVFLKAGPRDVVKVHIAALKEKTGGGGVNPARAQVYVEEARVMVLQLMGHLVSEYRTLSMGAAAMKAREKTQKGDL